MNIRPTVSDFEVEVSGWDSGDGFFVEKATLEVGQPGERFIYLRHPVRPGLMLFLRLVDSRVGYPTFPVPYRVLQVNSAEGSALHRVILQKVERRRPVSGTVPDESAGTELL